MKDDSIANTIQPPALDCTEIIDQVMERIAEKQQEQMNLLTGMISALPSLISFYNQQQQVHNSSAHNFHTVELGLSQIPVIIFLQLESHLVIKRQAIIMVELGFYHKVIILQ